MKTVEKSVKKTGTPVFFRTNEKPVFRLSYILIPVWLRLSTKAFCAIRYNSTRGARHTSIPVAIMA